MTTETTTPTDSPAQESPVDRPSVAADSPTAPGEGDGQDTTPPDAQEAAEVALGQLFSEFTDSVRGLLGAEDRLRAGWADADEAGRHDLLIALYSAAQETAEVGLRLWGPAFIMDPLTRTPLVDPKAGDVNPPTEPLIAADALRRYADRHHAHPGGPTNLIQTLTIREAAGAIYDYDACRSCSARLDEHGQCTGERERLLLAAQRIAAGEPDPADPPRPGTEWTPEPIAGEAGRG